MARSASSWATDGIEITDTIQDNATPSSSFAFDTSNSGGNWHND
jgi:hypothetical protein